MTSTSVYQALDLGSILKPLQAISGEFVIDKLISTLMQVIIENVGAEKGALILAREEVLVIEAIATTSQVTLLPSEPLDANLKVPASIINYVHSTGEKLLLDEPASQTNFAADPYIIQEKSKSVLCLPLRHEDNLIGILYLENNLTTQAFTSDRIEILSILCSQAAISLANAQLYQKLDRSLQEVQQAQMHLIQTEKISTLSQLLPGVAHEINNPLGFINGNIDQIVLSVNDIVNHLQLYQDKYPDPGEEIIEDAEDIDLEYLLEDLPKMLESMKDGSNRIRQITSSLRVFSRGDTTSKTAYNIHEGIDSILVILKHRTKAKDTRPEIKIVQEYGDLPDIKCYPGQINQVFMNILSNAIEAFDELNEGRSYQQIQANPNQIIIRTAISADDNQVEIRIIDNGPGMTEEVQKQAFDYLFTTKGVGKGTGLGLAISRQIVEEKHGGKLSCISTVGEGTEFMISIPVQ